MKIFQKRILTEKVNDEVVVVVRIVNLEGRPKIEKNEKEVKIRRSQNEKTEKNETKKRRPKPCP